MHNAGVTQSDTETTTGLLQNDNNLFIIAPTRPRPFPSTGGNNFLRCLQTSTGRGLALYRCANLDLRKSMESAAYRDPSTKTSSSGSKIWTWRSMKRCFGGTREWRRFWSWLKASWSSWGWKSPHIERRLSAVWLNFVPNITVRSLFRSIDTSFFQPTTNKCSSDAAIPETSAGF